jgi:DNA-binding NarL/FixJ family response regulator
MKILLADDHALFREGMHHVMHQLHDQLDGKAEILDASTFPEALDIAEKNPDIALALLDLKMPGSEGAPAIRLFHTRFPAIAIVVLSGTDQREDVLGAINGGAAGFIPKSSNSKEMVQALRTVLEGGTYLPAQLLQNARSDRPNWRLNKFGLTARQIEVLQYLGQGWSNKSIAEATGLSQGTVKIHVAAVFNILRVNNRIDAVLAGRRLGLLDSTDQQPS